MGVHTINELKQFQAMPLEVKVAMTKTRIRDWVNEFGVDGVYVSFSGGKDSTVLLHLVREEYPDVKAVFVDTGLEYPEIREFVKTFDNVDWVKPKMNFRQVIDKYGYPMISKEVSECAYGAKRYLEQEVKGVPPSERQYKYFYDKLRGDGKYSKQESTESGKSKYSQEKYKFFLEAPFEISNRCCNVMKKNPAHEYAKKTKRKAITAQMAAESRLRTQKWLQYGCNGFDMKNPISNPMSFWTEQDVLRYIKDNNIKIASVYGDIVYDNYEELEGQMDLSDFGLSKEVRELKTTKCQRTGCCMCGYGVHLEKSPNRFELIEVVSNPNLCDYILRGGKFNDEGEWTISNEGLGYWFVLKYINIYGGFNINIPQYEYYRDKYGNNMTKKYLGE